jgi:hypothetical protein
LRRTWRAPSRNSASRWRFRPMTEPEEQLRAYATAVSRAQRAVELGEIVSRRRHTRRPLAVAAAVVAVAVIAGSIAIARSHHGPTSLEVSPPSSSTSTALPAIDCPAASISVHGTSGETLDATWIPPGFKQTSGSATDLGPPGGPPYFALGGTDPPFVLLSRFHSSGPLADLLGMGTRKAQSIGILGHTGVITDAGFGPRPTTAIAWKYSPGIELEVRAHNISSADAIRVANSVQYTPGGTFVYPINPDVTVTREQADSKLAKRSTADVHAALTSFGEFTAVRAHDANHRSTIAPDVPVAAPVWVAWAPNRAKNSDAAIVVDARSGETIASIPRIDALALESLTDRTTRACAPPFGVLTRSEATYIRQPVGGKTVTMKLVTLNDLIRLPDFAVFANCGLQECDATVPVWMTIATASDHRFLLGGPGGGLRIVGATGPRVTTTTIKAGSFTVLGMDARTGPQDTNLDGSTSGAGRPSARLLALPDLSPI